MGQTGIRRMAAGGAFLVAVLGSAWPKGAVCRAQAPASQPTDEETEALIERLREGRGGPQDIAQRITRLMEGSRRRLAVGFDTGQTTQRLQEQILRELESAIDLAKRNLRPHGVAEAARRQRAEKRRAGRRQEPSKTKTAKPGDQAAADRQSPPGGGTEEAGSSQAGPVSPPRRAWGNLPDRDREAVIQGFKEAYLGKYGELIEEYYRALSEEVKE